MTALWIILGIFAFFALLLALPLRIFLRYSPEDGLQYRVKYAFIPLADSQAPEKQKPEKAPETQKQKRSSGAAVRTLLSFLGLEDVSSAANVRHAIGEKGLVETLRGVTAAVGALLRRTGRLLRKGVFKKFDLSIVCGDDDPADAAARYGTLCAAVYPLLTMLDSAMKFRRRRVDIRCDFSQEGTQVSFDGQLNYRPWHFVCFLCGLFWQYLKHKTMKEG